MLTATASPTVRVNRQKGVLVGVLIMLPAVPGRVGT